MEIYGQGQACSSIWEFRQASERSVVVIQSASKWVNTGDFLEFLGAFTRPVIFTLSFLYFCISHLSSISNLCQWLWLNSYNPCEPPYASIDAEGPEIGPPLSPFPLKDIERAGRIKVGSVNKAQLAFEIG
jgi:hypothetical protein